MCKRKTIIFILDSFELYGFNTKYKHVNYTYCYSYFDTEDAINAGIDNINTYDIGHLSFDLEDLGYDIFIGYNGKIYMFRTGMSTANGKELRKGHNLYRLLIGGALDDNLKIDRKNFYYDKSIPTSELCQRERDSQKAIIDCALKVVPKTIGFDLTLMDFEDIGKNLKSLIERCTNGKMTTNGANGITEQLITKNKD